MRGYDADGNTVTIDGHTAYTYGPFNRLVNAAGYAYTYSAAGPRVEKAGASGTTYFAPGSGTLLAEDLNNIWRDYVYLNGRLVSVTAHGDLYSVHADQTGRPLAITATNSHTALWEAAGQPFSRYVTVNNWGTLNLGFPGQYLDAEDGLWHNGYRDYDASMGRYIESDPIGLAGGVNTYAYVGGNPITGADPLGLCKPCTWTQKAAAKLASMYATESEIGSILTIEGLGATEYLGTTGESATLGLDSEATGILGLATGAAGLESIVTGALSAGLNSYASGSLSDLRGYTAGRLASMATEFATSRVPGAATAGKLMGELAGKAAEGSVPSMPTPCTSGQ